tara:strand:+ start:201 stop:704 length:504 start_codon:yes stop_codon:yes gene_type:complete
MIKKKLIILLITLMIPNNVFSAGSDDSSETSNSKLDKMQKYRTALGFIKKAKKFETKDKIEKAKKSYQKAYDRLIIANNDVPNNPDILNYLGFTSRKLGKFENAEIYYLLGLEIDPKHFGINEYLGELYVNTKRLDKAKERLNVLKDCNCKEYAQLKEAIEQGSSRY